MSFVASIVVPATTPFRVNFSDLFAVVSPDGIATPRHLFPATATAKDLGGASPSVRRLDRRPRRRATSIAGAGPDVQRDQFATASPRRIPRGGPAFSDTQLTALRI